MNRISEIFIFVENANNVSGKMSWLFHEVVKFMLKKYAGDRSITEFKTTIHFYMQQANMTSQEHPGSLAAKSFIFAGSFDDRTLNNVSIDDMDYSIRDSRRLNSNRNSQPDLTNIEFHQKN